MSDTSDSQLDALLARLPRDISPAKDLWPYIEAQASVRRFPRPRPWQLAAGIAALAVSTAVGLQQWHRSAPLAPGSARVGQMYQASSFEASREASYLRARAELERSYRAQLDQLPPDTRTQIEHDLDVIRNARDDIHRALASDPGSPLLQELIATTWQQEIDLYRDVAASSAVSNRRNL